MIRAEAFDDDGIPPRVVIASDANGPVWRDGPDGRVQVRATSDRTAGGTDYEVTPGEAYTYSIGDESDEVRVPGTMSAWLVPVGREHLACPLIVAKDGFSAWKWGARGSIADLPGRRTPVAARIARGAMTSTLSCYAERIDDLRTALEAPATYWLSWPSDHWPGLASYVDIGDTNFEVVGTSREQWWRISLELTEQDRPTVLSPRTSLRWRDLTGVWGDSGDLAWGDGGLL